MGFVVHFQRCTSAQQERAPGEWAEGVNDSMVPDSQRFSDKYQWSIEDDDLLVVEVDENTGKRKNIAAFAHWDMVVPTEKTE